VVILIFKRYLIIILTKINMKLKKLSQYSLLNKSTRYFCQSNNLFKDKVTIVTGGGQGIGRSTCIQFTKEGSKVLIADTNPKASIETVNIIKQNCGECSYLQADISKEEDCRKITEETVKRYGKVNVLVNCATMFIFKGLSATREEWIKSLEVNVLGYAFVTKFAVDELKKHKNSAIVNVSSIAAFTAGANVFVYSAEKAAVLQLTRNLALDLATFGIRVNCVCPGIINTATVGLAAKAYNMNEKDFIAFYKDKSFIKRMGEPEEVANGIVFLASDKASYITGTHLMIDGGYTIL
jgi:NAD(P)-dependent dehydrogenase (short-subunit alcohol dehydrogenase family)